MKSSKAHSNEKYNTRGGYKLYNKEKQTRPMNNAANSTRHLRESPNMVNVALGTTTFHQVFCTLTLVQ